MPIRTGLRASVISVLVAVALASTMTAPSASAQSATYLQSTCTVKALTIDGGPHGDGCAVHGLPTPTTVGDPASQPLPDTILQPVLGCIKEGAIEFVKALPEIEEEIPPQYAKGVGAAYFAVGCVSGVAEAMIGLN